MGQDEFLHFNFVISIYRLFCKSRGPFEDKYFKLLLIRSLIDALGDAGWTYSVPSMKDLVGALAGTDEKVSYTALETRKNYDTFRRNFERLMQSGILGTEAGNTMREQIRPFDERFAWTLER